MRTRRGNQKTSTRAKQNKEISWTGEKGGAPPTRISLKKEKRAMRWVGGGGYVLKGGLREVGGWGRGIFRGERYSPHPLSGGSKGKGLKKKKTPTGGKRKCIL